MDELFHVSERKSTIGTELRAGLTTFLAMAYIIAVNPAVLSGADIHKVAPEVPVPESR